MRYIAMMIVCKNDISTNLRRYKTLTLLYISYYKNI